MFLVCLLHATGAVAATVDVTDYDKLYPEVETGFFDTTLVTLPDFRNIIDIVAMGFCITGLFLVTAPNRVEILKPLLGRSGILMAYGKFAHITQKGFLVPSRIGMFLIYFPSFLAGVILIFLWPSEWYDCRQVCELYFGETFFGRNRGDYVVVALTLHFAKRCAECLWLHKYSRTMPFMTTQSIAGLYLFGTWGAIYFARMLKPWCYNDAMLVLGLAFVAIGISGNFYHHYLLAMLRKPGVAGNGAQQGSYYVTEWANEDDKPTRTSSTNPFSVEGALGNQLQFQREYKVPMGGLFPYSACAHYLFELMIWLGMAFMVQHIYGYGYFLCMFLYLTDRSVAQQAWSREKIPGYPANRKNLIPGIW